MRITLVLLTAFVFIFFNNSFPQEKEIREDLTVTNVEVPVRIFFRGEPVKGLKQSDFILLEAGKQQEINGFYEVTKVINKESVELASERTEAFIPRYFVLVFRVQLVPDSLKKSVSYLFRDVLRAEDKLLAFVNNKTIFFNSLNNKERVLSIMVGTLTAEAVKERFRFEKYYQKVSQSIDHSRIAVLMETDKTAGMFASSDVIIFLRNYLQIWNEYKKKYLLPDIDNYYNFSKFLEKINLEKWVISFYQFEKFPELKLTGKFRTQVRGLIDKMQLGRGEEVAKSRIISKLLMDIDKELKVSQDFPSEEISRMFSKVNTTFHSLFFTTMNDINSQDFSFKEISTDLENTLRGLTKATGGELIVSNKLEKSLEKVVKTEDSYYMLTYSPESARKKGKIKVRIKSKNYDVHYDNNIRADYIEDYLKRRASEVTFVKLEDVGFSRGNLSFRITDITRRDTGNGNEGNVKIHIVVKTPENQSVYDQSRMLNTKKGDLTIDIKMEWLKPGEYDLTVDVTDILSGRSVFEYLKIKVK